VEGWWIRYHEYFQREKEALDRLGYNWKIDETAFGEGRLIINVVYPYEDGVINLEASYPDSFPYFMPTVSSTNILLEYHQNPIGNTFCLLAESGAKWNPAFDTLATLIQDQLPEVLRAKEARGDVNCAVNEEKAAEPISAFLNYLKPGVIIHPGWSPPEDISYGTLILAERSSKRRSREDGFYTFAIVRKFLDGVGHEAVVFPEAEKLGHTYTEPLLGFWFRVQKKPEAKDAKTITQFVTDNIPEAIRSRLPLNNNKKFVIAMTYQDELTWEGNNEQDWLFFSAFSQGKPEQDKVVGLKMHPIVADCGRKEALLVRTPELSPLSGKRVLVVGLGSLGSPLVTELARAGVGELELCDYDSLQVGNSVRWALGWSMAGHFKTQALQFFLTENFPHTNIELIHRRLGEPPRPISEPNAEKTFDVAIMEKAISKADLVIDASAEYRVHHFLADTCQTFQKSYLWLSTTHGALGGRIGRIIPNTGQGCFHCAMHHIADGNIVRPPEQEGVRLQAPGCAALTFTGAGIDATTIAIQASRLAIATLCRDHENAYPDFNWNLAVIRLRDTEGSSVLQETDVYQLDPHPECQCQK